MANIKVVPRSLTYAYTQRQGDFSPNLVGRQLTDGASLFTFGNFNITTNLQSRRVQNFSLGGEWSQYYNLDNLNLTETQSQTLSTVSNDIFIKLNFNPYNITRYVYFGSFREFIRVTIENIIKKWKGSIFLDPKGVQNTILSFNYNSGTDTSEFNVPVSLIHNPYSLIIEDNIDFANLPQGEIYNLSRDYNKYVIYDGQKSYDVIGFTGSSTNKNYLRVKTKGNPFPFIVGTFAPVRYHLKPNNTEVELFFNELDDFEKIILNRLTNPIYTSTFSVPTDFEGTIRNVETKFSWPITDGYNLDNGSFQGGGAPNGPYQDYITNLIAMGENFDQFKTDLVARRFVSESIHEYDTNDGYVGTDAIIYGRKVNKLLRIYGREFDTVKKYIDGISFANVVTYNKSDNTSDELIKVIAKNLGFDVLLTLGTDNFDLLQQIQPSFTTPFSGYSRSLSSKELDIELWRRLVINAWWLFKSKGARKVIEFFLNLFKMPECMISLNEYIYLAENKLNYDEIVRQLLEIYALANPRANTPDLFIQSVNINGAIIPSPDAMPMDQEGFPRVPIDTPDNYFQMAGHWYNGGNTSTNGNNPHIGPYDYGRSYFSQFECFIKNFDILVTGTSIVTGYINHFNNYNNGTFIFDQNGLPVPYYGTTYANTLNLNNLTENAVITSAGLTQVGTPNGPGYTRPEGDNFSMKVTFKAGGLNTCTSVRECSRDNIIFGEDGIVYLNTPNGLVPLTDQECCKTYWLPATTTTSVLCPTGNQTYIGSNNVLYQVTQTKLDIPIPVECCSKMILGFDVFWDGTNCIVNTGGGTTTTAISACTKCRTTNITPPTRNYSALDLLIDSVKVTEATTPEFLCYWCPPKKYTQVVCSTDEYLAILDQQQIINYATALGWVDDGTISVNQFLFNIYEKFFLKYGCVLLDYLNNFIQNKLCCKMRGGDLVEVNGVKYCVIKNADPCFGAYIPPRTHLWVTPDINGDGKPDLLPESCCTRDGMYWITPIPTAPNTNISLVQLNGTVQTFLDIPGFTETNSLTYCSSCSNKLIQEIDSSGYIYISEQVFNGPNKNLSRLCCIKYGFNWDDKQFKCANCPITVNVGTTLDPNLITDLNGNNLSKQCCDLQNGWYGVPATIGTLPGKEKCYICPAMNIYDSNSNVIPNPDYQLVPTSINGVSYTEIFYANTPLSYTCCLNYGGNWDGVLKKCFV